jgi:XTP/dITP diphosphohydrolase
VLTLYAATSNAGKLREFQAAARQAPIPLQAEPLPGFAGLPRCPEDGASFAENAQKKALHYSSLVTGLVFADDSGLRVDALGGAPGVLSARYSGAMAEDVASEDAASMDAGNNQKLLRELAALPAADRRARFVCVITLACAGRLLGTFEGQVEGLIADAPRGRGGFGYDPLFLLPELGRTFGELAPEEKLRCSHRGNAFRAMVEWLVVQKQI